MEKYILELISENNRVIIPNFGAFIISKKHGISILFNNFLSFNDGLLVNYVAEKKGIDTIIATDQIFAYVDNLKKELDETGSYPIEKLGVFKKDDNAILRFQQAEDLGENFEKEETKEKDESKANEKTEVVLLDIDDDISSVPEGEKTESVLNEQNIVSESDSDNLLTIDTESESADNTTTPTQDISKKEIIKPVTKEKNTENHKLITSKQMQKKPGSYYAKKVIHEKKRTDVITFIVITGVILISLAIYLLFFSDFSESNKEREIAEAIEKHIVKKPVKKDTLPLVIKKPEIKQELVIEPIAITKGLIHIIVGGYKVENNANKMAEKLRKSGYEKAQIVAKGNMFLVSIYSDFSYRQMENKQQDILENEKLESWMYQIK